MPIADWIQSRPLRTAGLLGLLVGTALGLAWPVSVPAPGKQRGETWAAPSGLDQVRPREIEFSTVRDAPIWGGAMVGTEAVKRAVWLLAGIIDDPLPAAIIISAGSKESKRVRVGGTLPDGGVVKKISTSGLTYTVDGCTFERLLYGPAEPVGNGSCGSEAK